MMHKNIEQLLIVYCYTNIRRYTNKYLLYIIENTNNGSSFKILQNV